MGTMRKHEIDDQLKKAVREYYEYQGDTKAVPVRFVENKHSSGFREEQTGRKIGGYDLLLVRFTDEAGDKMSALMEYTDWKDGHWDVTEIIAELRQCEDRMVKDFEESEDYI